MVPETRTCPTCGRKIPLDVLVCPHDGTLLSRDEQDAPCTGVEGPSGLRLSSVLGRGSMATVYRGRTRDGDDVAVKVLHSEVLSQPDVVKRFVREADIASSFDHPGLVRVLEAGHLDCHGMRIPYLVTPLIDGVTLEELLTQAARGRLDTERCVRLMLSLCEGVGYAHERGVVHRDLKPDNIVVTGDTSSANEQVKVLDFGLARVDQTSLSFATKTGQVLGTAEYISPEAAQGLRVGPAGDVYSLAAIMYRCLAGRPLFDADSGLQMLLAQISDEPTPIGEAAPEARIPTAIAEVVMENLAKLPEDRAANAAELAERLRKAAEIAGLQLAAASPESRSQVPDETIESTAPESASPRSSQSTPTQVLPTKRSEPVTNEPSPSLDRLPETQADLRGVADVQSLSSELARPPLTAADGKAPESRERKRPRGRPPWWLVASVVVVCYVLGVIIAALVSRQLGWWVATRPSSVVVVEGQS